MTDPVTYWNTHGTWEDTLAGVKGFTVIEGAPQPDPKLTLFEALAKLRFGGNWREAITWVQYNHQHKQLPYIRVGVDFFKVINKTDRYGFSRTVLKPWKAEILRSDIGRDILPHIPQFDDFCIIPDNTAHQISHKNCYNMYARFIHQPYAGQVHEQMMPSTTKLMRHVFGDQLQQGLLYLQVLYQMPWQALPILCLVSEERETGKTTFLNWLSMLFGDNFILINPEDLLSSFNANYASKNLIALDETVIDRVHAVEKLKNMATSKWISVNQKHVSNYSIPFFGKIIIATNRVYDFMRIDEEEIRYWIRKVPPVTGKKNLKIEDQLRDEIPYFLKFLQNQPAVEMKSRMVFAPDELQNEHLEAVKRESFSGLRKELYILIEEFFLQNTGMESFMASSRDIKEQWFALDRQVSANYITRVLTREMKLEQHKVMLYAAFNNDPANKKLSRPFQFDKAAFACGYLSTEMAEQADLPF